MKIRFLALSAIALALVACNAGKGNANNVTVGNSSTDDQKFAYMLGTQFGNQYNLITKQFELTADDAEFMQGVEDGKKMMADTAFHLKYSDDVLRGEGMVMQKRAEALRQLRMPPKPDSTKVDSVPLPPPPTVDSLSKEDLQRFSYMLGVQFGSQFGGISKQFGSDFDILYFKQGLRDMAKSLADTSFKLPLSQDTLRSVNDRFRNKALQIRAGEEKKAKEEETKLKADVAPLRGDTLPDGYPVKMNFKVKVTGISVEASNLEAYAGKPLLVFYFSTTCGHCRHATPEIQAIVNSFKDKGLSFIAIASGGNNKRGIRGFIDEFKMDNAEVFFDESRQFGELYGDGYVPKVYVVKPDGKYTIYKNFEKEQDSIRVELSKVLAK